eukprot:2234283-Pyramimonas_sp.AAC.1
MSVLPVQSVKSRHCEVRIACIRHVLYLASTPVGTLKQTFAPTSPGEGSPPGLWSGYMSKGAKPQTALREMFSIAPSSSNLQDPASLQTSWGGPKNR